MAHPASSHHGSLETVALVAAFAKSLAELSGDAEMPLQQQQLLFALYMNGELMQSELERHTGVGKSANSRNISKLGDGERPHVKLGPGFVESYDDPNNRRTRIVRLSSKGRRMLESAALRASTSRSVGVA